MSDETELCITIGDQQLDKGKVRDGKSLIAWDCIQDCVPARCPIGEVCDYRRKNVKGRCALQIEYIQAFTTTVFETYRYLDEGDMFKIGMHLVPLYSQLCRQKIVEKSVGSICYEDAKGVTRIHPIYKEIRETIKVITSLWQDIGMKGGPLPELPGGKKDSFVNGRSGYGDPNHYATITANADNKRNVTR